MRALNGGGLGRDMRYEDHQIFSQRNKILILWQLPFD